MKVLFLTRRFWPEVGGVETHTLEVSKRLVELGHRVTVISEESLTNPSTSGESFGHPRGVFTAYKIPAGKDNWFKKWRIWKWLWKNRQLIKQVDIVHAHDVGFWHWPFRILYPSKPFFITFHGWEGKFPIPLKNKIVRKISEKMARGNICVGDYIKKWYGTQPDFVTYGGISFFPPPRGSPSDRSATPEVSLPLVFIGRLEKDTGLPVYLEALRRESEILFLGDGSLRKEAEKYGQVLGFVKNIRPYILKSRFVFTSGYLSILEAMACKKLVFAVYDNPLKEDYLKMAPFAKWIVIESTRQALFNQLKYYFEHPEEERKLISEGYQWVKKQSWEKTVSLYLKLWKI